MTPTILVRLLLSAQAPDVPKDERSAGAIVRDLLTAPTPTPQQVAIFAGFLLTILAILVALELVRRRRQQLARNRSRWENFSVLAHLHGLDDTAIDRMREMHLGLDALHAPDAMLRIPAVYDRALDAWIASRGGQLSEEEWESLEKVRALLKFKALSAETSLSHTRQISDRQEVRLATEDGHWNATGTVLSNREERLLLEVEGNLPRGHERLRVAFSRAGDGEYKVTAAVLSMDAAERVIHVAHTDQLVRQQLRMWVRVPVLLAGKMRNVIGPEGVPHPNKDFEVTLLDLSGGGAMVSAADPVEVESRGLLDFALGDSLLEGVRFVMLRTGRPSKVGGHVCHLCFESIDVQTQEKIMRYVFERQRAGRLGT
jgi:hypothetical protein